ncbi:MAG: hypothetical protein JWR32_4329 [Mycobacterium sp.]|jgi:hypothetical protein|nr:hypothetical protein [Mycobacterium sp.]
MRGDERPARLCTSPTAQTGRILAMTCGNVLPRFTGGQVVAGSNPAVSPTEKLGSELRRSILQGCVLRPYGPICDWFGDHVGLAGSLEGACLALIANLDVG